MPYDKFEDLIYGLFILNAKEAGKTNAEAEAEADEALYGKSREELEKEHRNNSKFLLNLVNKR